MIGVTVVFTLVAIRYLTNPFQAIGGRQWFDTVGLTKNVTLVVHDWGSALGFHRFARYPKQIKAIVYMEAIAMPRHWEDFGKASIMFQQLRSSSGEQMVLDANFFVEQVLPRGVLRRLTEEEMENYRAPFRERESRLPTLTWPRQIPIEGVPADVTAIVQNYGMALASSSIPKLLIVGNPGAIITGRTLDFCRRWPNQKEVPVSGAHFLQEDSPHEIGRALQDFLQSLSWTAPECQQQRFRAPRAPNERGRLTMAHLAQELLAPQEARTQFGRSVRTDIWRSAYKRHESCRSFYVNSRHFHFKYAIHIRVIEVILFEIIKNRPSANSRCIFHCICQRICSAVRGFPRLHCDSDSVVCNSGSCPSPWTILHDDVRAGTAVRLPHGAARHSCARNA